ncbi:hypothetical protein FACS1894152_6690 [Bacilli bacterium]|nr:hypothetical protein FACS1894152_6690 [Bacilli bacterium]
MSKMYSEELEKYITRERLEPYLKLTNGDFEMAVRLYVLYTKINESLYFPLQNVELTVRNSFYKIIAEKYGDNWIFDTKYLLKGRDKSNDLLIKQINLAIERKKRKQINIDDLISNLSFGFWTTLLDSNFEVFFWRPCLRKLFRKSSNVLLRKEIQTEIKFIKEARNRIFHHENLLKYNLLDTYNKITSFIGLISEEFASWTREQSSFIHHYANLQNFLEENQISMGFDR